ncbi:MAG: hypothetical protein V1724_05710 [Chloroflexota bacterium]
MKHQIRLQKTVIHLYRNGYTEAEIIELRDRIGSLYKLGAAWLVVHPRTVNRWLKAAREADPDLEIAHLVNRRRWKPGIYANWKAEGQVILMPFYDPIRGKMYLGAGDTFFQLSAGPQVEMVKPPEAIEQEQRWQQERERDLQGVSWVSDIPQAPPIAVVLHTDYGYSYRDIAKLSKQQWSRFRDRDKAPGVQELIKGLRHTGELSYSKVRRIILEYDRQQARKAMMQQRTATFDFRTGEIVEDWHDTKGETP